MEYYKDIPGYDGKYQISDTGIVKSLERFGSDGRKVNARILKPRIAKGYLRNTLTKNGKMKTFSVHQLVAMAFLGHKPNGNTMVCDHKDNNKLNNHVDNIQIVTNRHNTSKDQNRSKRTSKYIGVSEQKRVGKNRWSALFKVNGKNERLGLFDTEIEAANAYQERLKQSINK